VPEALHTSSMAKYWSPWQVCSETINYTPTAQNLPRDVYPGLINAGLKVLIFNGDFDLCVPENDNEGWTYGMGYPVKNAWASWSINEGTGVGNQVAGYLTQFTVPNGSFAFATVKGAGHMVPEFQPQSAFQMYKNFLTGAW
jgi:serine carboxypeptidase-like clade I